MNERTSPEDQRFTYIIISGFCFIISALLFFHGGNSTPFTGYEPVTPSTPTGSIVVSPTSSVIAAQNSPAAQTTVVAVNPPPTIQSSSIPSQTAATVAPSPTPAAASPAVSVATQVPTQQLTAPPASASVTVRGNKLLTKSQQEFAIQMAKRTGLDGNVVAAWVLNEQSGGAAAAREAAGNHNWLNIGYTDSAERGTGNSYWFRGPIVAADASAAWMKGELVVEGFGRAAPGITKILESVGKSPAEQIQALQRSPWASGHYPSLGSIYQNIVANNVYPSGAPRRSVADYGAYYDVRLRGQKPTVTIDQLRAFLTGPECAGNSTALEEPGFVEAVYNFGVSYDLDPAFTIAMFVKTGCGNTDLSKKTKAIANIASQSQDQVATPEQRGSVGGYRSYHTWTAGVKDWNVYLLFEYVGNKGLYNPGRIVTQGYLRGSAENIQVEFMNEVQRLVRRVRGDSDS